MFKASSIIQFGSITSYFLASAGNIGRYEAVEERAGSCLVGGPWV